MGTTSREYSARDYPRTHAWPRQDHLSNYVQNERRKTPRHVPTTPRISERGSHRKSTPPVQGSECQPKDEYYFEALTLIDKRTGRKYDVTNTDGHVLGYVHPNCEWIRGDFALVTYKTEESGEEPDGTKSMGEVSGVILMLPEWNPAAKALYDLLIRHGPRRGIVCDNDPSENKVKKVLKRHRKAMNTMKKEDLFNYGYGCSENGKRPSECVPN
jgi:hypothetical protein